MPKHRSALAPLLPAPNPSATTPLHRQLFDALRAAILEGRLSAGSRLPSTRDLGREIGVSRNTVMAAYEQLVAEGFLEGRTGSGTYVSTTMPGDLISARASRKATPVPAEAPLSARGAVLARASVTEPGAAGREVRPFRAGVPDLDAFPGDTWARLSSRRWRASSSDLLGYGDPAGLLDLRRAIAAYLRLSRGVRCGAEQIVIVGGSQQGLDLVARLLLDPGDIAWVEDPGYAGVTGALRGTGVTPVPVPVDDQGLVVEAGERLAPNALLVSVTPSHQYPVGVTMSLARRLALLEWASRAGAWVLEDDYDAEFRYAGRPLEALQGLDDDGRVIYLGTFSKVLAPALRLGYLVVPPGLVAAFSRAREVSGRHAPMVEQAVLADFMVEGHFARHLRRMQGIYAERQAALLAAARDLAGGLIDVRPADAGLHAVGWLPEGSDGGRVARRAAALGVSVYPFVLPVTSGPPRHGLMLGYAPYTPGATREAMARLAEAITTS
jgi:GntR family transcriptional regulator / MocR family aminotransferase